MPQKLVRKYLGKQQETAAMMSLILRLYVYFVSRKSKKSSFVFCIRFAHTTKNLKCKLRIFEQVSKLRIGFASCSMASNCRRRKQLIDDLSKNVCANLEWRLKRTRKVVCANLDNEIDSTRCRRKAKLNDLDQNFISVLRTIVVCLIMLCDQFAFYGIKSQK